MIFISIKKKKKIINKVLKYNSNIISNNKYKNSLIFLNQNLTILEIHELQSLLLKNNIFIKNFNPKLLNIKEFNNIYTNLIIIYSENINELQNLYDFCIYKKKHNNNIILSKLHLYIQNHKLNLIYSFNFNYINPLINKNLYKNLNKLDFYKKINFTLFNKNILLNKFYLTYF